MLVVCEGNICRSPMAQAVFRSRLPGWRIESAGLNAVLGAPAERIAIELLRERGMDISKHRAVQLTRRACVASDMVLVMENEQRQRLQELYPEIRGRVFRLGEGADADVPDPFGQSEKAFRQAFSMIDEGVANWVRRIQSI